MTAGVEWTAGPRFGVSLGVFNPTFLPADGWLKSRVDLMGVLKLKSTVGVDLAGVLKLKSAVDLPGVRKTSLERVWFMFKHVLAGVLVISIAFLKGVFDLLGMTLGISNVGALSAPLSNVALAFSAKVFSKPESSNSS